MKKILKLSLMSSLICLSLIACNKQTSKIQESTTVETEQITQSEPNKDNAPSKKTSNDDIPKEETKSNLSVKKNETMKQPNNKPAPEPPIIEDNTPRDISHLPDETAPELVIASIYYTNSKGNLDMTFTDLTHLDATLLFEALKQTGSINKNANLLSYTNNNHIIDLNLENIDLTNKKTLVSIVNTFIENFEADTININVSGKDNSSTQNLTYFRDYKKIN